MSVWLVKSKENCKEYRNGRYSEQLLPRGAEVEHLRKLPLYPQAIGIRLRPPWTGLVAPWVAEKLLWHQQNLLKICPPELSRNHLLSCPGRLFMGWFLTGGALLQNCSRCLEKLLVAAGHHGAAELGAGEAACAAGARHRPGSVEKYTSMMTGLERGKREAEQQGD